LTSSVKSNLQTALSSKNRQWWISCRGKKLSTALGLPSFSVYLLEPDAVVNTEEVYQDLPGQPRGEDDDLYQGLLQELQSPTLSGLANLAVASARRRQAFLEKPYLEDLIGLCDRPGICGLNVAHSGTVVALWFKPEEVEPDTIHGWVDTIDQAQVYTHHQVLHQVSGGGQIVNSQ